MWSPGIDELDHDHELLLVQLDRDLFDVRSSSEPCRPKLKLETTYQGNIADLSCLFDLISVEYYPKNKGVSQNNKAFSR